MVKKNHPPLPVRFWITRVELMAAFLMPSGLKRSVEF